VVAPVDQQVAPVRFFSKSSTLYEEYFFKAAT
jgi:hypothetical protein